MNRRNATPAADPLPLPMEPQVLATAVALDMVQNAMTNAEVLEKPVAEVIPAAVVTRQPAAPMTPGMPAATPMQLLTMAMTNGASMEVLERMLALQERWEANEARAEFNRAFAAFKAEAVTIVKNVKVTDGPLKGKSYADLFAVVSAITAALSKHGLSFSWRLTRDEPNWLEVECCLRHERGHMETVTMGGPPDTGGAKNAIQARASTKAYLERYTLLAITGMAASGKDTDGRAMGAAVQSLFDTCNTLEELTATYKDEYRKAQAAKDMPALAALVAAKDKRKAELQGGAR